MRVIIALGWVLEMILIAKRRAPQSKPIRGSPLREQREFRAISLSPASRCSRECVKTCEIVVHADVGGVLVTPRLLTCKELRGERATYIHSGKRNRRVFTQSREQREFVALYGVRRLEPPHSKYDPSAAQ